MGFKLVTLSNESGLDDDLRQDAGEPDPEGFRRQGVRSEDTNREWRVGIVQFATRCSPTLRRYPNDPGTRHSPAS
mgnify:CR=1 FL=1